MAHKTLETEMKAVHYFQAISADVLLNNSNDSVNDRKETNVRKQVNRAINLTPIQENDSKAVSESENSSTETSVQECNKSYKSDKQLIDNRVDKVYTIGCFDLFHHGHIRLIERMRQVGKKVIIGVHDSRRYI
jgi:bifunctional ADP-heptose synthase (sugar kinase/adenylyltransferase)